LQNFCQKSGAEPTKFFHRRFDFLAPGLQRF